MNIYRIIKSLSLRQAISLLGKGILNPILSSCFFVATQKSLRMCNRHFKGLHHKNNQTNAYRHALWNMLIIYYSTKAGKSIATAADWAKEITDQHEALFKNSPLERQMDLHNNRIGRFLYSELSTPSIALIHHRLLDKLKTAVQLIPGKVPLKFPSELVYIESI